MRTLTLAAVLTLLAGATVAQQQTFRNERGQITGSSSTSGNVTTFRDRSGRMTGTAERMRDGSVQYRDARSEEHTSELQSRGHLVCRLLLEKKKKNKYIHKKPKTKQNNNT